MRLTLDGLTAAPAQVWGNIRLVPLVRDAPIEDLRLALRRFEADGPRVVRVSKRTAYTSYIPYGLVVQWSPDGEPMTAIEGHLGAREEKKIRSLNGASSLLSRELAKVAFTKRKAALGIPKCGLLIPSGVNPSKCVRVRRHALASLRG